MSPVSRLDFGTIRWDRKDRFNPEKDKAAYPFAIYENERLLWLRFAVNLYHPEELKFYNAVYDKSRDEVKVSPFKEQVTDDINGFFPLQPTFITPMGEFAQLVSAATLLEWFDTHADNEAWLPYESLSQGARTEGYEMFNEKTNTAMKRLLVILTIVLISQAGYGQQKMDQLFNAFRSESDVTSVNIGNITMKLASLFTETMGVNGIEVLSFDECAQEVKERFSNTIRNLKDPDYETIVSANENDNRTKILVNIQEDMIRELVILTTGSGNALIRIKGNIKPDDLDRVINEHKGKY